MKAENLLSKQITPPYVICRTSVNRRIWKWVSILQGYNMEIRHIPGKINPTDTITRQVRSEDQVYAGEVKQMDNELVDAIRIPVNASDADVQRKLNQLYSKDGTRDKLKEAKQQVLTMNEEDSFNTVLAVSESSVHIDN